MSELNTYNIAQAISIISMSIGMLAALQKNDVKLKKMLVAFQMIHMTHFLLLNALTSALTCLFAGLRTAVSLKTASPIAAYGFAALTVLLSPLVVNSPIDYLPVVGSCIGTIALYRLTGIKMRAAFIVVSICWLINNIIVGSIGGIALEVTIITLNLITMYRIFRDEKRVSAFE
ncbi:YgjV family protein [Vibrio owensii]|uniref:YgjV family protein n=1 Tax=Vibrio owensii TaxID=696485 RepID=UPI0018F1FE0D|nr:YgjV family protein [Vibrio owensii]